MATEVALRAAPVLASQLVADAEKHNDTHATAVQAALALARAVVVCLEAIAETAPDDPFDGLVPESGFYPGGRPR